MQRAIRSIKILKNQIDWDTLSKSITKEQVEYGLGILEVLLALRFVFDIFNASELNLIAKLVYAVTFPFIAPFWAVFGRISYALSNAELATLAAMLTYPIVVWAILAFKKQKPAAA